MNRFTQRKRRAGTMVGVVIVIVLLLLLTMLALNFVRDDVPTGSSPEVELKPDP